VLCAHTRLRANRYGCAEAQGEMSTGPRAIGGPGRAGVSRTPPIARAAPGRTTLYGRARASRLREPTLAHGHA
jgi:hypothetical protein